MWGGGVVGLRGGWGGGWGGGGGGGGGGGPTPAPRPGGRPGGNGRPPTSTPITGPSPVNLQPITLQELDYILKQCKNNRAPGLDSTPVET